MSQGKRDRFFLMAIFLLLIIFSGCNPLSRKDALFKVLDDKATGLHFTNQLTATQNFNLFNYMYFYNGGGAGAADFNNDGLIDLFFAANQGKNKLFLNKGNLQFTEVTDAAGIVQDSGWSTGVSVVDINNDGLMDIYVCRVGQLQGIPKSHNLLLICTGIDKNGQPSYQEKSQEYGLAFSGFSTQAVFFDYDKDGDLDMYLLNHTIHNNGTFGIREGLLKTYNPLSGDRIYRNETGHFTDATAETGIHSSVIGYGLGVVVADINMDGYPDIYVGNDFHENDYLYINQRNGTFKDDLTSQLTHTSQFSMGVDAADANNDGFPEIVSMDMLPSDAYILKRSLGEDEYDIFYHKIDYGYNYQYTRNNLQFNRGNAMFSEVGLYAGVAATDWSWAPLWMDFDNDGKKDLFISNGIPKRMNDIDYINFISNGEVQQKIKVNSIGEKDMALIDKFPQIKIPNRFFRNAGDLKFDDMASNIEGDLPTYSNGAVYADFDNDGDLDIVVNNIDEPVLLYQNKSNDKNDKPYVELKLSGTPTNINAIGAKVILYANGGIRTYEKFAARGFMSSMEIPLHIGLADTKIDSAFLVWPDNTFQALNVRADKKKITAEYKKGLPVFNYQLVTAFRESNTKQAKDITADAGLAYLHKENSFHEFDREALIPHMVSTEGPALAVGDINKDGKEDVFIGSSRFGKNGLFVQQATGSFIRIAVPSLDLDSNYENVSACFADVNNDGHTDLVVAGAGNEFFGEDPNLRPRVYLNNGNLQFTKLENAFDAFYINASCVVPYDFNADGYTDLFIGGRSVPYAYGETPASYLLQNNGKGHFTDVTSKYAKSLSHIGMVTQALWFDLDKNGSKDLIVCTEWGGITAFLNNHGVFTEKVITDKKGWWNFVLPVDVNNDGNVDLIAGNLGLNSRLKASAEEPVRLYYNDFDDNGRKEQVLTYYLQGKEIPFASKAELEKQIPLLKKRFLYADDFAKASLENLFTREKLQAANVLTANYFSNAVFINKGTLNFEVVPLPWQAQLSAYKDAVVVNANNDSLPDIFLAGNYYENNIEMGRYDADFGTILLNKGNGRFAVQSLNGLTVKGQVRHIGRISIGGKEAFILAKNNDSTMVIEFSEK
ncbi:MAG: VCBS repeat-containing protein [Chitinophagaceae bacterium]